MNEVLCTQCGQVGAPKAGKCAFCASADVLPADSPNARAFIDKRAAKKAAPTEDSGNSVRAEATGKVLGRALGKLFKK